jgi:hypothetical protein
MSANAAFKFSVVSAEPQLCTNTVQDVDSAVRSDKEFLFLNLLSEGVSVCEACERAGIPRRSVYARRNADKSFADQWDECLRMAADTLEGEADRRGRDGWSEHVYYRGQIVGQRKRYSDRMLMFRLKALKPERYKDVR